MKYVTQQSIKSNNSMKVTYSTEKEGQGSLENCKIVSLCPNTEEGTIFSGDIRKNELSLCPKL